MILLKYSSLQLLSWPHIKKLYKNKYYIRLYIIGIKVVFRYKVIIKKIILMSLIQCKKFIVKETYIIVVVVKIKIKIKEIVTIYKIIVSSPNTKSRLQVKMV